MPFQASQSAPRLLRVPSTAIAATWALLGIAAVVPADAKIAFQGPSSEFATGSTPTSVAIADLDRDGKADLVVTNSAVYSASRISSISILRGRGDGTFEPHRVIPVGNVPQAVVIEDLNGDGLLDLAIANYGELPVFAASVSVLLGNGDGTFQPATDYPAGDKVRSLSIVDLNGDGHLDLLTEDAVLLGNGDGTFRTALGYGTELDWNVAVGDLNGDGRLDIVTSNIFADGNTEDDPYLRAYSVRLGNGDGTFQAPVRQGRGLSCWGVALADLDGDALLDLVICNFGDDRGNSSGVLVHLGRGDGTFGPAQLFPTGLGPKSVAIADLNGDGKLDLVTANNTGDPDVQESSLTILFGNGDGTFRRGADLQTGEAPVFVTAGRLDANASLDLVSVNQLGFTVSVFMGNGDGTFGSPDIPMGGRPTGLDAADFNRDGRVDLVVSRWDPPYAGPGPVSVLFGKGDGTFSEPLGFPSPSGQMFVTAADLNGDHVPDFALSTESGVLVMMANGDGTFAAPVETSPFYYPGRPAFGDLNGDGRADMVVPNERTGAVWTFLGRGDGSFASGTRFETGLDPHSAAIGDLNGDGKLDIVVGLAGFSVSVLLGRGDGSFSPHVDYSSGNYFANAAPLELADLDEDGRIDVVDGDRVWIGNGDGTIRAGAKFYGWPGEQGIVLQDLDGDHHVDLAGLHGYETGTVSIYPGRGDGTFGTPVDYGTGAWPLGLAAGDFDGDGGTDLAVANSGWGAFSISILLNRSEGPVVPVSFELRPAVVNSRSEARWITGVIDLAAPDGAGDVDVATIRLNGVVPVDGAAPSPQGQRGARELRVQFDRNALMAVLPAGERVPVTVTGRLGQGSFAGTATIRVLSDRGRSPLDQSPVRVRHVLGVRVASPVRAEAGALRLTITLEEDGPARLDLLDVEGRVIGTRRVESFTAGPHDVELASASSLSPGVYFLRLRQGAREVRAKAAIVR